MPYEWQPYPCIALPSSEQGTQAFSQMFLGTNSENNYTDTIGRPLAVMASILATFSANALCFSIAPNDFADICVTGVRSCNLRQQAYSQPGEYAPQSASSYSELCVGMGSNPCPGIAFGSRSRGAVQGDSVIQMAYTGKHTIFTVMDRR